MKSGFKDPTSIKKQAPRDHPKDGIKSPWDFTCPQYDQRTSCFVNAGTHYGVGHRQPVGRMGDPKQMAPTLPQDRKGVHAMQVDEAG